MKWYSVSKTMNLISTWIFLISRSHALKKFSSWKFFHFLWAFAPRFETAENFHVDYNEFEMVVAVECEVQYSVFLFEIFPRKSTLFSICCWSACCLSTLRCFEPLWNAHWPCRPLFVDFLKKRTQPKLNRRVVRAEGTTGTKAKSSEHLVIDRK